MTAPESRPELDSVQALRGLAAMLVVIYHVTGVQKDELIPGLWERGYAGVDMFFVISGFILTYVTHTYARTLGTAGRFLYARATRIYPLWWVIASILPAYFLLSYGTVVSPDRMMPASDAWTYLGKSLLLWPQSELPVLNVGWTLIHEVYFYLVFSLALLFRRNALPVLLIAWGALTLAGSWRAVAGSPLMELVTSQLTLEFIAGAFIGLAIRRRLFFLPRTFIVLGAAGLLMAMVLYAAPPSQGTPITGRVAVYMLPCCALLYGSVVMEQSRSVRIPAGWVVLGNWSYALYLVHLIIMIVLLRLSRTADALLPPDWRPYLVFSEPGLWGNLVFTTVMITASIASAAIAHHYVERPLLRLTRKIIRRPRLAT